MKPTDDQYTYFQPGEIVFILGSNPAAINKRRINFRNARFNKKINSLISWSNQLAKKYDLTIKRQLERELHFPIDPHVPSWKSPISKMGLSYKQRKKILKPNPYSLIPVQVKRSSVNIKSKTDEYIQQAELAELIKDLQSNIKNSNDPNLIAVSPNWIASPASEYGGGGGPGSLPIPYIGDPGTAPHQFSLPDNFKKLCPSNYVERGKGVKVAILDTAPSTHELTWAYERFHKVNPGNQREHHPLIESLLKPGGAFHLHPASMNDLFRMRAVHLRDHNYDMTDHGLFVAGIIHSIAPAAEIHLYEVLNSEGVGDLVTIFNALSSIAQEQMDYFKETGEFQRLVVNCSLMLNIPLNGDPSTPSSVKLIASPDHPDSPPIVGHRLINLDPSILEIILKDPDWVKHTGSPIEAICDLLFQSSSKVIAAAGNDWRMGDPGRPQARMPASFDSVQGVAAFAKDQNQTAFLQTGDYQAASYSNISDEPNDVGVVTLGGEAGEGKGVLGIYIGNFPPFDKISFGQRIIKYLIELLGGKYLEPRNKSNWAWWSGTSFATPILTGSIAAVLSNPNNGTYSVQDAITAMYTEKVILNNSLKNSGSYQEDMLYVTQG